MFYFHQTPNTSMKAHGVHHNFAGSLSTLARPSHLCKTSNSAILILVKGILPLRCSKSRFSIHCAARFRPCIDIHKGKVKQIVGSTLQDFKDGGSDLVTNFESDKSASEFADMYKKDKLTGGHVIMLGADSLSISATCEALHAYPGGFQVGGGVNSDNALSYIEEGASHVIVTSHVFNDGHMDLQRLEDLVRLIGKKRLVLDLSCRKKDGKYAVVTDRWQKFSNVYLNEETLEFLAIHADEFLVHGVDVEGKKLGIDEELVALLGRLSPVYYIGVYYCVVLINMHSCDLCRRRYNNGRLGEDKGGRCGTRGRHSRKCFGHFWW